MLNNIKTVEDLKEKLLKVYSKSTVHKDYQKNWHKNNPTYGQCIPTALLVQELFGGEIYKLESEAHYYNLIEGKVVDLTKEQFTEPLDYSQGIKKITPFKKEMLTRYDKLKTKLLKEEANADKSV